MSPIAFLRVLQGAPDRATLSYHLSCHLGCLLSLSSSGPQDLESSPYVGGWAQASLHIKDDDQDVTYESDRVWLFFMKRSTSDRRWS